MTFADQLAALPDTDAIARLVDTGGSLVVATDDGVLDDVAPVALQPEDFALGRQVVLLDTAVFETGGIELAMVQHAIFLDADDVMAVSVPIMGGVRVGHDIPALTFPACALFFDRPEPDA